MAQQKIAGVKCFCLEAGAVARDEEPMADHVSQKLDGAEGREFAAELRIFWVCGLRKNEPNAVVARRFGGIPEHTNQVVAEVDGEAREHAAHLGVQWHERIQNERIRRLLFWFG